MDGLEYYNHTYINYIYIYIYDLTTCYYYYYSLFQVDSALAVDAVETVRRALEAMLSKDSLVFQHTFRRGSIYNRNRTLGIPCTTRPVIPWMHGHALYSALKQVGTGG